MADRDAEQKQAEKVVGLLTTYGLADHLSYTSFLDLTRAIVRMVVPKNGIATVDEPWGDQPADQVAWVIAMAIQNAALDAREDRTPIDPEARANAYLLQLPKEVRDALLDLADGVTSEAPPESPRSRCREILDRNRQGRGPVTLRGR